MRYKTYCSGIMSHHWSLLLVPNSQNTRAYNASATEITRTLIQRSKNVEKESILWKIEDGKYLCKDWTSARKYNKSEIEERPTSGELSVQGESKVTEVLTIPAVHILMELLNVYEPQKGAQNSKFWRKMHFFYFESPGF